ncbi:type IV secretion system protein, partial [Escherichia coli]
MKTKFAIIMSAIILMMVAPAAFSAAPEAQFNGLLELIEQSSSGWFDALLGYAKTLFMGLALISIVMTFFPLVNEGPDFGKLFGEMIRLFLTLWFFYMLMVNANEWGMAVVDSFRQAGGAAIGASKELDPADVFTMGVDLANTIGAAKTWNPLEGFMIGLSALLVLLSFVFMAA